MFKIINMKLRKKRIVNYKQIAYVALFVSIPVFAFVFRCANINNSTVETMAVPVTDKTIVIDAGHGSPDEGDYLLTLTAKIVLNPKSWTV